jgi:uncharacterized small protein (DUF1192 family)
MSENKKSSKKKKIEPLEMSEFEEINNRATWTNEDIERVKATVQAYTSYKRMYENACEELSKDYY